MYTCGNKQPHNGYMYTYAKHRLKHITLLIYSLQFYRHCTLYVYHTLCKHIINIQMTGSSSHVVWSFLTNSLHALIFWYQELLWQQESYSNGIIHFPLCKQSTIKPVKFSPSERVGRGLGWQPRPHKSPHGFCSSTPNMFPPLMSQQQSPKKILAPLTCNGGRRTVYFGDGSSKHYMRNHSEVKKTSLSWDSCISCIRFVKSLSY